MMKTQLNIQCPKCGARLKIAVKAGANLQKLALTCPVCKVKSPLSEYRRLDHPIPNNSNPRLPDPPVYSDPQNLYGRRTSYEVPPTGGEFGSSTRYESANKASATGGATSYENVNGGFNSFGGYKGYNDLDKTSVDPIVRIGVLRDTNGLVYPLQIGRNVIGRKAASSSASIQLDMGGLLRMGREHLNIDVSGNSFSGYVYTVSLVKEHCNYTAINGNELRFGDFVTLNSGERISLPDIDLTFEIP
ncbi:MAG: hypothetical protein NC097_05805 [Clostridium sp.]|nr:hypothetical protein [Prevotella sp.]MCM1429293.1 hypothetical protein [Clostridium sp.]MCM1475674.1 hypothetical protein [Muribaculaceae bacterium]